MKQTQRIGQASGLELRLYELVQPSLQDMGYDVVQVRLREGPRRLTLQIMIERLDAVVVTVDDCEKVSYQVSALLDVADPIEREYQLEISSAGIDRPLTRLKDFIAFTGHEAKISSEPVNGRRHFRGVLEGVDGETVLLKLPDAPEIVRIDSNLITSAKLVLTDALLKLGHK